MAKPVRILMVEDSAFDAELSLALLRKADLAPQVTLARDRRSFESELLARPYDLVLADYALPDFNGIAALRMCREAIPQTPVIFISGQVGEEVAIDTLHRGATDYVLKHRLERLAPAVLRALNEAGEHATRIEAEAMFRESELRFRHVTDALPQMIWVANTDGDLSYVNQAWHAYIGDGVTRWCDPSFFDGEDYQACSAAWHMALETGRPFTNEVRLLRRSDGTYRAHVLRMLPMLVGHTAAHPTMLWLGTATDIQDQKLQEEALRTAEKLSVTGRIAATIAHEINNPLESLTNLIYLVREESAGNPRALSFLSMASAELDRIASITKQTLQFHRDPAVPVEVDAREILEEVMRLFASRIASKSLATSVTAQPGVTFEAIKGEIRQVLINLVNNAIDAVGPRGEIVVEAAEIKRNGEPAVEMVVCDNGSGIAAGQAEKLFQPFFSTKGAHGTGLGLWVSRGIVEKHGGTLHLGPCETKPGRTVATVRLPRKAPSELHHQTAPH